MKLLDIAKRVGGKLIKNAIPGAGLVFDVLDAAGVTLDHDNATGDDILRAAKTLPSDKQAELLSQQIDVEVQLDDNRTERYVAMCNADGQESRAKAMMRAMNTLIVLSVIFVLATAYVYMTKGAAEAFSVEMAGVYLTVTGTFAYVVRAYFGDLKSETESRHAVATGVAKPLKGIAAVVGALRR